MLIILLIILTCLFTVNIKTGLNSCVVKFLKLMPAEIDVISLSQNFDLEMDGCKDNIHVGIKEGQV
jgi:hypothetical protein